MLFFDSSNSRVMPASTRSVTPAVRALKLFSATSCDFVAKPRNFSYCLRLRLSKFFLLFRFCWFVMALFLALDISCIRVFCLSRIFFFSAAFLAFLSAERSYSKSSSRFFAYISSLATTAASLCKRVVMSSNDSKFPAYLISRSSFVTFSSTFYLRNSSVCT